MKVVIVGAGDQARVVYDIFEENPSIEVVNFISDFMKHSDEKINGIPIKKFDFLPTLLEQGVNRFIVAIGDNKIRASHFNKLIGMGMEPINAIASTAHVSKKAKIGKGVTIFPGVIIRTGTEIGNNTIINTGSIIEHDNAIGDHVHIAPGCSLAGRVAVKNGSFVGIGSSVIQRITIGRNSVVGAGSVIIRDVPDNVVVVGVPTRTIKELSPEKEFGDHQAFKIKENRKE